MNGFAKMGIDWGACDRLESFQLARGGNVIFLQIILVLNRVAIRPYFVRIVLINRPPSLQNKKCPYL